MPLDEHIPRRILLQSLRDLIEYIERIDDLLVIVCAWRNGAGWSRPSGRKNFWFFEDAELNSASSWACCEFVESIL
ncbi:hypothetical protein OKW30_002755 [Paraburkholderia sp. Clong3]|uniref:hypothetical protein n=1 Tax=Paraburkholderia sp. Clong3 TaxID=2991061 RepID=UPI003D1DE85B